MQTQKMSLANIKGKLSRAEMKAVVGGIRAYVVCGCIKNGVATPINCFYPTPISTCLTDNNCSGWSCPISQW